MVEKLLQWLNLTIRVVKLLHSQPAMSLTSGGVHVGCSPVLDPFLMSSFYACVSQSMLQNSDSKRFPLERVYEREIAVVRRHRQ